MEFRTPDSFVIHSKAKLDQDQHLKLELMGGELAGVDLLRGNMPRMKQKPPASQHRLTLSAERLASGVSRLSPVRRGCLIH